MSLSNVAVGAPFVGALVAALIVADAVRVACGESPHLVIDGDLGNLSSVDAVRMPEDVYFNLGSVCAQK